LVIAVGVYSQFLVLVFKAKQDYSEKIKLDSPSMLNLFTLFRYCYLV